jgi:acetylornithine deacetylase/succinyl-diaminopimelate desuccinylase-like protein
MRPSHLEDFYSFLRFPSISTDDAFREKTSACARWLVDKLTAFGLEVKLVPTAGHPVVWAKNKHQPGRRTAITTCSRPIRWNSGIRPLLNQC